jgi:hypothetical protein
VAFGTRLGAFTSRRWLVLPPFLPELAGGLLFKKDGVFALFCVGQSGADAQLGSRAIVRGEEEEEEEDLFLFNDTIKGPRASAVKPGRITQA